MVFFLWGAGETIDAKAHDNVTILFSDIVGFTSICSTTTPFMVIKMLEDLYSQFDEFCGVLDVYKVNIINFKTIIGNNFYIFGTNLKRSKIQRPNPIIIIMII